MLTVVNASVSLANTAVSLHDGGLCKLIGDQERGTIAKELTKEVNAKGGALLVGKSASWPFSISIDTPGPYPITLETSLSSTPVIDASGLSVSMDGRFGDKKGVAPVKCSSLSALPASSRDVTLLFGDCFFNSLLYEVFTHGLASSIPVHYKNTTYVLDPLAPVSVTGNSMSIQYEVSQFKTHDIYQFGAAANFSLLLSGPLLHGSLSSVQMEYVYLVNVTGKFNLSKLDPLIDALLKAEALPAINQILGKGIMLPPLMGLKLTNDQVQVGTNYLLLETDLLTNEMVRPDKLKIF